MIAGLVAALEVVGLRTRASAAARPVPAAMAPLVPYTTRAGKGWDGTFTARCDADGCGFPNATWRRGNVVDCPRCEGWSVPAQARRRVSRVTTIPGHAA